MLDLSAAFDIVNHSILLERLATRYGIGGIALEWFRSYLSNRKSFVSVENGLSNPRSLNCGVPQGSVLGPILFMLYTSPIGDIVRSYDINFHLYADDSQLYITFLTSSMSQLDNAKSTLEACVTEIDKWMLQNSLKMNGEKTDYFTIFFLSSRPSIDSVSIAGHDVSFFKKARNIGVIFDENISLDHHIASICKSCFFHLRNISKIRKHISSRACKTLIYMLSYLQNLTSAIPFFMACQNHPFKNYSLYRMLQLGCLLFLINMNTFLQFCANFIGYLLNNVFSIRSFCSLLKLSITVLPLIYLIYSRLINQQGF